ncbi:MAG: GNAT family N-acetyltransferase, partial [Calditrichaeota bacterium]|nr:GNAT family N-acetyltransferase [Calditrichota bacterium]
MNVQIRELEQNESVPKQLLLTADPSEEVQSEYLNSGKCYVAELNKEIIGEYVLLRLNTVLAEIKNIAVVEEFQNHGIGKQLIKHACRTAQKLNCSEIQICTGNSSIKQLKLYQKMGFEIDRIVKNYFIENYSQHIFE